MFRNHHDKFLSRDEGLLTLSKDSFLKCGLWTSMIQELIGMEMIVPNSRPTESESLRQGASNLCFYRPSTLIHLARVGTTQKTYISTMVTVSELPYHLHQGQVLVWCLWNWRQCIAHPLINGDYWEWSGQQVFYFFSNALFFFLKHKDAIWST